MSRKCTNKNIVKIAASTRKTLERIAPQLGCLAKHLGGMCAHASVMLHSELKKAGYKPKLISGGGHWFVLCNKNMVDITATQFGQPKIVVRNYEKVCKENESGIYQRNYWIKYGEFDTPCAAGLCNLKAQIKKAMNVTQQECNKCKNEEL